MIPLIPLFSDRGASGQIFLFSLCFSAVKNYATFGNLRILSVYSLFPKVFSQKQTGSTGSLYFNKISSY